MESNALCVVGSQSVATGVTVSRARLVMVDRDRDRDPVHVVSLTITLEDRFEVRRISLVNLAFRNSYAPSGISPTWKLVTSGVECFPR